MHFIPLLLLTTLLLSHCATAQNAQNALDKNIDVQTAQNILQQQQVILLDVRTAEEFSQGHIPGAKNIDYHASDFAEALKKLDPQHHYVVYCASGNRSQKAAQQMTDMGFTQVQNVQGGFQAWQSQNLPVE